ncbi:hypothetical protein [Herminiimonas sp. CN]|uniref:hypothetical protein n=1 Tax=Herminiimonas sp. CN TaxID=1349818 RepID=UPI000473D759|nr:hypothetical protein [Herminiimonas sp. CN]
MDGVSEQDYLVGWEVFHKSYGAGVIVSAAYKRFVCEFQSGLREFPYGVLASGDFRGEPGKITRRLAVLDKTKAQERLGEAAAEAKRYGLRQYERDVESCLGGRAVVSLEPLRAAIRHYSMTDIWRDGIGERTLEESYARGVKRVLAARDMYLRLMSNQPDFDSDFRRWAIKKALGLRTSTRYSAQPTGRKLWRGWGASPSEE